MPNYNIRRGMTLYGADNRSLGTVDDVNDTYFTVGGQQYPLNGGYRVENDYVYLNGDQNYAANNQNYAANNQNELRVPVMEEQLNVEKRQAQLGEVQIHKTVEQEQVNVPVELRREEVHVEQRDINRPIQAGEVDTAFQEGTIRVPVRGEEAIVNKQAVVTGEVAVNKNVTAEQQTVADTVRRERVDVDDSSVRQSAGVVQNEGYQTNNYATNANDYAANSANYAAPAASSDYATTTDTNYASTGAAEYGANAAGGNYASNLREGQDVVGNDGEFIGRVKELRDNEFRVDRTAKPDINVTYSTIQSVNADQVVLNGPGNDFNNFI